MNTTITITPEAEQAWQWRLNKFNAGSGKAPLGLDEYIQARFDENTARYQVQILDERKLALASNTRMVRIGIALLNLPDDEMEAKLNQIDQIVS